MGFRELYTERREYTEQNAIDLSLFIADIQNDDSFFNGTLSPTKLVEYMNKSSWVLAFVSCGNIPKVSAMAGYASTILAAMADLLDKDRQSIEASLKQGYNKLRTIRTYYDSHPEAKKVSARTTLLKFIDESFEVPVDIGDIQKAW